MGSLGTGKSTSTRAITEVLRSIIVDYDDVIKQATPTGCASFQMGGNATTVHKLFGLHIKSKIGDLDEKALKALIEKFKHGLCLLIIDEFSMESRAMIGLIINRLREAHIDLKRIGIVFIGDSAQLLPIGGEPCWSIKLKRTTLKDFSEDSYIGLVEFRSLFRMPKLEKLPNFNLFKRIESLKDTNELQRKQVAEFTASSFDGDYDAVYLTEIKRNAGDEISYEYVSELLPCLRYGNMSDIPYLRMKFADEEEVSNNEKWLEARIMGEQKWDLRDPGYMKSGL